jgi:heterodisulfide reductase subunit C
MNCPEHVIGATHTYRSRNGSHHQVFRRDIQTAEIVMPNGRRCLGMFRDERVVRDPVPFATGKFITLRRCSPTEHTQVELQ